MKWTEQKKKICKINQYWLCIITHVLIGFPTFSRSFSPSDFHNISIYFDLIIQISVKYLFIWKNLFVTHHKCFKIYPLTELNLWNKCIKIAWFMFLIKLGPRIFFSKCLNWWLCFRCWKLNKRNQFLIWHGYHCIKLLSTINRLNQRKTKPMDTIRNKNKTKNTTNWNKKCTYK